LHALLPTKGLISEHGWNPLNCAVLDLEEIRQTQIVEDEPASFIPSIQTPQSTSVDASPTIVHENLNISKGLAGAVVTDVLQYVVKQKCVQENLQQRYIQANLLKKELSDGKQRLTTGNLFKSNKVPLDAEVRC